MQCTCRRQVLAAACHYIFADCYRMLI